MNDEVQQLLDAEAAIAKVLGELDQLKKRVEGYSSARESLDAACEELGEFLTHSFRLAEESGRAVETLKSLSMPEVLSRLGAFREALDTALVSLSARFDDLAASHGARVDGAMSQLRSDVAQLMRSASEESKDLLVRLGDQTRAQLAEGQSATRHQLDGMRDGVRDVVAATMHRAGEAQQAQLAAFGKQQAAMVGQGLEQVRADVSTRLAPLATKTDAAEKATSRLVRLVAIQAACIAVLAIAVIVVLVMLAIRS